MLWLDIKSSIGNNKFNSSLQYDHLFKEKMILLNFLPMAFKTNKMLYGFLINYCLDHNHKNLLPKAINQLESSGLETEAQQLIHDSNANNSGFFNKQLSGLYNFFK